MVRKRTTASKKRVLQLAQDQNSQFVLKGLPESVKSLESDEQNLKKRKKKCTESLKPSVAPSVTPLVASGQLEEFDSEDDLPVFKKSSCNERASVVKKLASGKRAISKVNTRSANSRHLGLKHTKTIPDTTVVAKTPRQPASKNGTGVSKTAQMSKNEKILGLSEPRECGIFLNDPPHGAVDDRIDDSDGSDVDEYYRTFLPVTNDKASERTSGNHPELADLLSSGKPSSALATKKNALEDNEKRYGKDTNTQNQNWVLAQPRTLSTVTPIVDALDQLNETVTGIEKSGELQDDHQPGPRKSREPTKVVPAERVANDHAVESDVEDDCLGFYDDDYELEPTVRKSPTFQQENSAPDCSCGLANEVAKLKAENSELLKQNKYLKNRKSILEQSHAKMQQALMSKLLPSTHKPFENVEGFPDCPSADKIAKMSVVAKDSDYVFIKLLMYAIWPDGFMGKSVTGRTSNNPKGRGKKNPPIDDDRAHVDERARTGRTALEKNKVQFINDCLVERRLLLHDNELVARKIASKCNRLMQNVISNCNRYN